MSYKTSKYIYGILYKNKLKTTHNNIVFINVDKINNKIPYISPLIEYGEYLFDWANALLYTDCKNKYLISYNIRNKAHQNINLESIYFDTNIPQINKLDIDVKTILYTIFLGKEFKKVDYSDDTDNKHLFANYVKNQINLDWWFPSYYVNLYMKKYENIRLKEDYSLLDNKILKIITKQSTHEPDKHYIFNKLPLTIDHNDNYEKNKNYIELFPDEHDWYAVSGRIPIKILSFKTAEFGNDNIVFELAFEKYTKNQEKSHASKSYC